MTFPANNLPTASKNWAREVEKKVTNLESSFRSAEVNNTTRDSQLSVTANSALAAATQASAAAAAASQAAADAQAAANTANTAATTANNAITGLGSLDEETSSYKINAANVTVGSLSGNRISGGEIVGTTLKTATSGGRIEMGRNDVLFYDDSGNYSGKIDAAESGRAATLTIDRGGVSGMYVYNGGVELYANGPVSVNAQQLISYGALSVTGNATIDQTLKIGGSSGTTLSREGDGRIRSDQGFLSSGPLGVTGNFTYVAPIGTGTTFPLYWNSSTNVVYRLSSSQRYKANIRDAEFDYDALLQAKVRTFKNKQDIEEVGEDAAEVTYGYIAEELHDLGLTDFVVYENDEDGNPRPESVNYMSMALASHEMLKHQGSLIKDLTARIEALESR